MNCDGVAWRSQTDLLCSYMEWNQIDFFFPRSLAPNSSNTTACLCVCVRTMRKQCSWHTAPSAAQDVYFFAHPLVWFPLPLLLKSFRLSVWRVCAGYLVAWLHVGKCFSSVKSVVATVSWVAVLFHTLWYLHGTVGNREPLLFFLALVCPNSENNLRDWKYLVV